MLFSLRVGLAVGLIYAATPLTAAREPARAGKPAPAEPASVLPAALAAPAAAVAACVASPLCREAADARLPIREILHHPASGPGRLPGAPPRLRGGLEPAEPRDALRRAPAEAKSVTAAASATATAAAATTLAPAKR